VPPGGRWISVVESFILAGGASSRMGSPKCDLVLGGVTLLERAVATMSEFTPGKVTAIVDQTYQQPENLPGVRFVTDLPFPGFANHPRAPIFGLYTALTLAQTEWIAILAVDLPFVTTELFQRLANQIGPDLDAIIPIQPDGRSQPLCAIYHVLAMKEHVLSNVRANNLRLHDLPNKFRQREVAFSEIGDLSRSELFFFNINTESDLELARRQTSVG
jgi:molybdenum cofactor guanylyltransferase